MNQNIKLIGPTDRYCAGTTCEIAVLEEGQIIIRRAVFCRFDVDGATAAVELYYCVQEPRLTWQGSVHRPTRHGTITRSAGLAAGSISP